MLSRRVGRFATIVDRLEKRGFVERQPNPDDRRYVRITASAAVREFLDKRYPMLAADPLFDVLRRISPSERKAIVTGIRILRKLLVEKQ